MRWQSRVYLASVVIMPCFPATGLQFLKCYELVTAFSDKWRSYAIFDFKKFKISLAGLVQRTNMHHQAKFSADPRNVVETMAVFQFFKIGRQPSWSFKSSKFYLPVRNGRPLCVFVPNFVAVGRTYADIWPIFDFTRFVLRVFGPPTKSICWSLCKIWLESVQYFR